VRQRPANGSQARLALCKATPKAREAQIQAIRDRWLAICSFGGRGLHSV